MKDFKTQKRRVSQFVSSGVPCGSLKPSSLSITSSARRKSSTPLTRYAFTEPFCSSLLGSRHLFWELRDSSTLKKTQLLGILPFCHSPLFQN
ncbi:hypothetical protein TGPRC2_206695 [Toxoplasma gondii TgCatPRC2]|uniref:Uncharacterized protein n=3 Tax=Toxoplasma gondii TaxID=5811 RepID=A0A151H414_TOXGO|nr:hypothetical protein TGME49_206695 [Toxoplasma gondii ME49]EPT29895.1 hypothetical protein TGME49_206695 [Toxoplasma gondii ME49]KYF44552.1 hypothetical protein TGARI_206695 [Toxoplasma gondii ARI]KYK64087.1 hypothetical protein TGPRC2_206695 [Toxoplasma gondii TgCatPRC2]|eukprot:XP_018637234.1 hypothetical protein TGME49_206695 [Toxoplasma gondii ME49]